MDEDRRVRGVIRTARNSRCDACEFPPLPRRPPTCLTHPASLHPPSHCRHSRLISHRTSLGRPLSRWVSSSPLQHLTYSLSPCALCTSLVSLSTPLQPLSLSDGGITPHLTPLTKPLQQTPSQRLTTRSFQSLILTHKLRRHLAAHPCPLSRWHPPHSVSISPLTASPQSAYLPASYVRMISPPISPLPGFSLSAHSNPLSASSSLLFPPSLFTWAPSPDSPTPFTLMASSPRALGFSFLPSLLSPPGLLSSPNDAGFNSSLPSFNLPAAVEEVDAPPSTGRSTSQSLTPEKQQGRPSPTLASAITMAIATSPRSPALPPTSPSHSPLLLSSFPPMATTSASQPTPAVAPCGSSQQSVCHPTLTLLRSSFDHHTAITAAEQSRWQLLLSTSSLHHTRAQAEVGRLYEHFDAIVRRLSGVYERRLDEDTGGAPLSSGSMEGERVKAEALKAVHTIADKFVTSRQAVLHLHLYQSSAAASKPPRTSSRSSSSSSSSSGNTSSASLPNSSSPPSSSRPIRKVRRVVNPPPPNSTSTKRSYFHKHSTAPLKQWLQVNMSDPYPSSEVKSELSTVSGLTYEQVQHWFINARMRVWRPMLRRQKEEQERRQREQQHTDGAMPTASMDCEQTTATAEDGDSSGCETSMKEEQAVACEVREWKLQSAEIVPELP